MANRITTAHLGLLVGQRKYHELRKLLSTMNEVDIANFISDLPTDEAVVTFRTLSKHMAADVFSELDPGVQQQLVGAINDREVASLLDGLAVDDAVDMLEEMPAPLVKRILETASADTRTLLNQYLHYPQDSVGSVMTAEFTDLRPDMTAKEAIKHIRSVGQDKETIYTCYVVDDSDLMLGIISVRTLLTADDGELVSDLMSTNIISAHARDDGEDAFKLLSRYGLISLPVTDEENHLVGIVTIDDAADVMQEETTEDLERMAAMVPSDKPYLKTSVKALARNRFVWLLILMLSGIVSEMVVGRYEAAIATVPLLVAFIPMLSDMGGDAGSQVSTLVIRAMALDEIEEKETMGVVVKELIVSLMVGIPLALINFLRVQLGHGEPIVAVTISLALVCTVFMANTLGVLLPVIARKLKIDPALMATPMIASVVDILSMMIYFGLARTLLHV